MTVHPVLESLKARGIRVTAPAGRLRVEAPQGRLSAADRETIRQHKAALLAALAAPTVPVEAAGEGIAPADHLGLPYQPCAACRGCHFWRDAAGWRCTDCQPPSRPFLGETCCIPPAGGPNPAPGPYELRPPWREPVTLEQALTRLVNRIDTLFHTAPAPPPEPADIITRWPHPDEMPMVEDLRRRMEAHDDSPVSYRTRNPYALLAAVMVPFVPFERLQTARLEDADWPPLASAVALLADLPVSFEPAPDEIEACVLARRASP